MIGVVRQLGSEAQANLEIPRRNQLVATKPIVRRGQGKARNLPGPMAKHRGLPHQATVTIGRTIRTTAALTSHLSGRRVMRRLITTTVAIRSRVPTIRRLRTRTRRRRLELIPHRVAAIRLRRAPTPRRAAAIQLPHPLIPRRAAVIRLHHTPTQHPATAIVAEATAVVAPAVVAEATVVVAEAVVVEVEVTAAVAPAGAAEVVVAVEARTAAEADRTGLTSFLENVRARPDLPGGLFAFRHQLQANFSPAGSSWRALCF